MNRILVWISAVLSALTPLVAEEAVMVVEAHSGKVLIGRNTTVKRPVASLTKVATGVLVVDWAEAAGTDLATTQVVVPNSVIGAGGANPMQLVPGERLTALDALFSAMLGSDNAAALTLADHVGREFLRRHGRSGDPVAAFVQEMNHLAEALNMRKTKFVNPHGLEAPDKIGLSTAADIAKLSIYAMRRPGMTFVTRQPSRKVTVQGVGGARSYQIKNTNELVSEHIIGVKTGTTAAAGECLSVSVEREPMIRTKADGTKGVTPRRLIIVLLDSQDRFTKARGLIKQGWGIYDSWVASGAVVTNPEREILTVPDPRG